MLYQIITLSVNQIITSYIITSYIIKSSHHTSSHHHIITSSHHHIITSSHLHIIHHHIITSSHQHITTSLHHTSSHRHITTLPYQSNFIHWPDISHFNSFFHFQIPHTWFYHLMNSLGSDSPTQRSFFFPNRFP